jgi:bla regulator protein blaR1
MSLFVFVAMSYPWWLKIGAPFANHLWQSTLFAAIAGLLTLLLRKNRADTRYTIWLLASVKFLLPSSLLVTLGGYFSLAQTSVTPPIEVFTVMQGVSEPFSAVKAASDTVSATTGVLTFVATILPMALLLIWVAGFLFVLSYWWVRMRRMTAAARDAKWLQEGREFSALLRAQQAAGERRPIPIALSSSALEPGVLGILHPVLILPAGISDRLTDSQLDAVITHELCHVRRRDNLAAALHMLVEALFWFHPLVWWLGARLVDERERACDEEVLALGNDPQVYAESILKTCEFYFESPLLCVSGVTGSNLKKRIEVIMRHQKPTNLNFARKLLLSSAGFLAVAIPLAFGLLHATQISAQSRPQESASAVAPFDSVYLAPNTTGEPMPPFIVYGRPMKAVQFKDGNNFLATNFSLRDLIKTAYMVQSLQVVGGPEWLDSVKYDVNAKVIGAELERIQQLSPDEKFEQMRSRVQALLKDRFKLVVHRETRTVPVYALVVTQNGRQLHAARPGDTYSDGLKDRAGRPLGPGKLSFPEANKLVAQAIPMKSLADWLGGQELGRLVADKTGLTSNYDVTLQFPVKSTNHWSEGQLVSALREQLGLTLEPQDASVEVLVIDHAEEPAKIVDSADALVAPR